MRIAVLLPSRGRPFQLQEAVNLMCRLESGLHEVVYAIGCDADDPRTIAMAHMLRLAHRRIEPHTFVRMGSLGAMVNELAKRTPADVYCSLCDDVEIVSQGWDGIIASAWNIDQRGVWWWRCPSNATFAIVSEKWRQAAGRIFTPYFPFWYDDMWLLEQWRLATGEAHRILDCTLNDLAPGTHRMRDLKFWCDFFLDRKEERRAEAIRIAGILGYTPAADPDRQELRPNETFVHADCEARQGDRSPPTSEYLRTYESARRMMSA